MSDSAKSSPMGNAVETPGGATPPVESILCTEELQRRPSRPHDYQKENAALTALVQALADTPQTILQTLADTLLDVCGAGSAGVSLLTTEDGGRRFYWPAIAGSWKPHIGGGTPRDFGPCGDVLDRNRTLLFTHVERRYTYFQPVQPPVEEALLVPFYVAGKAVGTIWAVAHDPGRKFDAEDERMMNSLGKFASTAYQVVFALDALRTQEDERKKAAHTYNLLAAIVDSSEDAIVSKDLNGVITSWNRGAEHLFGYAAEEAIGRNIMLIIPADRKEEETGILKRIRQGERIDHFETLRLKKDGTLIDLSLTISPVKDDAGHIVGASKVGRDISERKRAEQAEQLRKLSSNLLRTQDEERRRIARELHDSAGQMIAVLSMNLAGLSQHASDNPTLVKALDETQNLLQELNKEIRTTSYLLHPPLLDHNGLRHAINWYIEGLSQRSALKINLDVAENFGRLHEDLELTIFRIVQEALTNIHRHSGSRTATIRLSRDAERVMLDIQDYGKGISPEKLAGIKAQRTGVGIAGMRERVRHLQGEMNIQSNANGALISVILPADLQPTEPALPEDKAV
jgi:PAS domain S-box-containing protein